MRRPGLVALVAIGALASWTPLPRAQEYGAPTVAAAAGGYFGVRGEPGTYKGHRGLTVTGVDEGSPAEAAGLAEGDLLIDLWRTQGPREAWLKRPQVHAADQGVLDAWLATQPPGEEIKARWLRGRSTFVKAVRLGGDPGVRAVSGAMVPDVVEAARTAYLQMCGKGQEKLSASTCDGMRRDLDAAVAAQAAASREAEVMAVYRQLCDPGARKLSGETCASMLAEAQRTLAADNAPPARAVNTPASGGAAGELKSAYDELCAPGAEQVSPETCAALKADAGPARRSR